jgi:acyl-ACP thioesterase
MHSTPQETTDEKRIRFYECDSMKRLKLSEILRYASELAGYDYTSKGFSHEFLMKNDMVFLVSKVSFRIFRMPADQQELRASTWEREIKGAVFIRGFEIKDASGELMLQGESFWILVNPLTRRILKPSSYDFKTEKFPERTAACEPNGKIKPGELSFAGSREVRRSDIDANGHVYNAVYADIAQDFISEEYFSRNPVNFRINYISEAKLGDVIDIYVSYEGKKAFVIGNTGDKTCFEAEFIYSEDIISGTSENK